MSDLPVSLPETIRAALPDRNLRFAFPSAVAADFWARAAVEEGWVAAVDRERFVAWDTFKEKTLAAERADAHPADAASRSIFCASLLGENASGAAAGHPLFQEIVAPAYAQSWNAFVASLSGTLPALDAFLRRPGAAPEPADAAYYADLSLLRDRYSAFLEVNGLFEPAWNRVPYRSAGCRWIIVCPELVDDWDEYAQELSAIPEVELFRASGLAAPGAPSAAVAGVLGGTRGRILSFATVQDELRWVARVASRLVDEAGLAPSDIAVTVPRIDDYAERLLLEFRLRDLPADLRKGRSILDHPAGRIFSALAACGSTRWSYRALKDLLLDGAYPWKSRRSADWLLDFGLRFRCVSGFPEGGKEVDVWERSFERLEPKAEELRIPIAGAAGFYRRLKKDVRAIVGAPTFGDLKQKLLEFKSNQLDEKLMDEEADRVFARAMDELQRLADTERRLDGVSVVDHYALFLTHLKSVNYVFQSESAGIRVFDYRVSALIGVQVHFILNATQSAASVRYDPAPFLREDRKLRAQLDERDLSAAFIEAYGKSGRAVVFSAPKKGPAGHEVPHRALAEERYKAPEGCAAAALEGRPDPYAVEAGISAGSGAVPRPNSVQAKGRSASAGRRAGEAPLDARRAALEDPDILARIEAKLSKDSTLPKLSPTDLNAINECPFSWLLRSCLRISETEFEIETVDARDLGVLYHRIFERFFKRLAAEGGRFRKTELVRYAAAMEEELDAALAERRDAEGAFQESVYAMYRLRMASALRDFLESQADILDGCAVVGAELPLRREYDDLALALTGKADLVFRTDGGSLSIYDFKTGTLPRPGDQKPDEQGNLPDTQFAAYVRMLEKDGGRVEDARFYSIEGREGKAVIGPERGPRSQMPLARSEYDGVLETLDQCVEGAASFVRSGTYPIPPRDPKGPCPSCRVRAVCRAPFAGGRP